MIGVRKLVFMGNVNECHQSVEVKPYAVYLTYTSSVERQDGFALHEWGSIVFYTTAYYLEKLYRKVGRYAWVVRNDTLPKVFERRIAKSNGLEIGAARCGSTPKQTEEEQPQLAWSRELNKPVRWFAINMPQVVD